MAVIKVPRPRSAMDPDRPVNTLLQAQIQHLQQAERRLPLRYRSLIYTHAVQTEGEAAEYIREVTEAIHRAHDDAAREREKRSAQREKSLTTADAARTSKKAVSKSKAKKTDKRRRKK